MTAEQIQGIFFAIVMTLGGIALAHLGGGIVRGCGKGDFEGWFITIIGLIVAIIGCATFGGYFI